MSLSDMENMTLGMLVDYLTICNNEDYDAQNRKKHGDAKYATQDDVNNF